MRRAPIVLTTTAAGLVGVLGFHARKPELGSAVVASRGPSAPTPSAPGPGTTSAPSAPPASSSSSGTKTATGDAIDTRYGAAQVRVKITNGRIVDVEALQLQGNEPRSVAISTAAAPQLRASALARQSAAVDAVSGATITSASYEASLQSALDKAGFKAADGSRGSSTIPQVQEDHGGPGGDGGPDGSGPPPGFFPG